MIRYFLDTHVVIWLITNDLRLDENLRLDIIIADCIANRYTMVSHDAKFPYYRKYGLNLLEV